jgi:hypothetical protein
MGDTFPRLLTDGEKNILHGLMLEDKESGYRAKVILLKNDGFAVPEIRRATNRHDVNIREWIHRFNGKGIADSIKNTQTQTSQDKRRGRKKYYRNGNK